MSPSRRSGTDAVRPIDRGRPIAISPATEDVRNDLQLALTLTGRDRQPLTVGLANLSAPHVAEENLAAAGSILNRYHGRGLFAGATKG